MKTQLLILFALLLSFSSIAQLKLGVHYGWPVSDYDDDLKTELGLDVYYMFGPDVVFDVGLASGYYHFVHDDEGPGTYANDDLGFIPVGVAARVSVLIIKAGADAGYAINVSGDADGGFYWRLQAGIGILGMIEAGAYYQNIYTDPGTLASWGLFAAIKL